MIKPFYEDVVMGRRSIRGFIDKPVPKKLISEIIQMAMRAPSSLNTQPWNFYVITGEPLDNIRKGNVERNLAGVPQSREFKTHEEYQGIHRQRQVELGKQIYGALGVARDDKQGRKNWVVRGFRQFDAPISIVITYDKVLVGNDIAPFDCGAVTNALVNAAWARGLGCVINSQGIMQSPVVREFAKIADDQTIMMCVAMGYPDENYPTNKVISTRKSVEEAVTFVGFDD